MQETSVSRGRPRQSYAGKFGDFVNNFGLENLATELDVDVRSIYGWMRGSNLPSAPRAFAIVEIAKRAGTKLTLEDVLAGKGKDARVRAHHHGEPIAASR